MHEPYTIVDAHTFAYGHCHTGTCNGERGVGGATGATDGVRRMPLH